MKDKKVMQLTLKSASKTSACIQNDVSFNLRVTDNENIFYVPGKPFQLGDGTWVQGSMLCKTIGPELFFFNDKLNTWEKVFQ